MSKFMGIRAHHAEAVDPTLVEWIIHKINQVIGLDSMTIVFLLGALIVLFPVSLLGFVWYQRRRMLRRGDG